MNENRVKFYSQNGEDFLLWNFFDCKREGFFVDIGAFDGIHLSNSYTFELEGWQGICVEPNPEIFAFLKRNRPRSICLEKACTGRDNRGGKTSLFVDEMGLLSSTIGDKEKYSDITQRYVKRGLPFNGLKTYEINTGTFDDILSHYRDGIINNSGVAEDTRTTGKVKIDFVSIDTEGNEMDIIGCIDFDRYDIRVMVVEYDERNMQEMVAFLAARGNFIFARRTPHNLVFVKTGEDLDKMRAIVIDCVIEKQVHPRGEHFTIPVFLTGKMIKQKINKDRSLFSGKGKRR